MLKEIKIRVQYLKYLEIKTMPIKSIFNFADHIFVIHPAWGKYKKKTYACAEFSTSAKVWKTEGTIQDCFNESLQILRKYRNKIAEKTQIEIDTHGILNKMDPVYRKKIKVIL